MGSRQPVMGLGNEEGGRAWCETSASQRQCGMEWLHYCTIAALNADLLPPSSPLSPETVCQPQAGRQGAMQTGRRKGGQGPCQAGKQASRQHGLTPGSTALSPLMPRKKAEGTRPVVTSMKAAMYSTATAQQAQQIKKGRQAGRAWKPCLEQRCKCRHGTARPALPAG